MNQAEADTVQRLTWLYGDPVERIRANHDDVMKWRHIGGYVYADSLADRFSLRLCHIARAGLVK